jgi:magnesium transporter
MIEATEPIAETARSHVETLVPTAGPDEPVAHAVTLLSSGQHAMADAIYIVGAQHRLLGVVPVTALLGGASDALLRSLMRPPPPSVDPDTDQEHVAALAHDHRLTTVPVVDAGGCFLGVVPPLALIDVLRREHDEDIRRLAGILGSAEHAKMALELPPWRRVGNRLPWLLVGLAGSALAAIVMAAFEAALAAQVAIAFFVPAIVYLADAIGTQTEAVAVRGLSLEHAPLGRVLWGELATGALLGLILGVLVVPLVLMLTGSPGLALAVATAVLMAGLAAAGIGLLFPWLLSRTGLDPAYGSGPVATIIQDVLTLLVYFACVRLFV